jgi:hypothetical protein
VNKASGRPVPYGELGSLRAGRILRLGNAVNAGLVEPGGAPRPSGT